MALFNPVVVSSLSHSSATVTPSEVDASIASVELLAANTNRKGATIWNNSAAQLHLELGAIASQTAFTARLEPNGYYEVPFGYTGEIAGIWTAANGKAHIREFV